MPHSQVSQFGNRTFLFPSHHGQGVTHRTTTATMVTYHFVASVGVLLVLEHLLSQNGQIMKISSRILPKEARVLAGVQDCSA